MPLSPPVLDHVVIDVRDRMDEALATFAGLGFQLTPRGHHTLGSMNHLAMFATDYLELLGFGAGGGSRPELAPFPVGLNGLVFKTGEFKPAAIQVTGDVAMACYWITFKWLDKDGNGTVRTLRITHAWLKTGNDWQIIGGMSMPEPNTPRD